MQKSVFLLHRALALKTQAELSRLLGVSPQVLSNQQRRGQLSPPIAFALAEALGENPLFWTAVAAAEGEKETSAKTRMIERLSEIETTVKNVVMS